MTGGYVERATKVRDVTVLAADAEHLDRIVDAMRALDGIEVLHASDRTFLMHLGGKIEMQSKVPLRTRDELSMAYTPGVARVCLAIAEDAENLHRYTMKANTVAVVTDGTAVLGLGDIGPEAALPVMEGKAVLFKTFAGVDAVPVCLKVSSADELVETVQRIEPMFGTVCMLDAGTPAFAHAGALSKTG